MRLLFRLVLSAMLLACPRTVAAQSFAAAPMRLAVKTERTTITVAKRAELSVTFLDRKYQATANDKRRRIGITPDPPSSGTTDKGSLEASPGQREIRIGFTPKKPGGVVIRVSSEGLEPATVLLTVTPSKNPEISLLPVALAQGDASLGFFVPDTEKPANGTSVIPFQVTLDRPSETETAVQITADSPATLLYEGRNTRHTNESLTIVIPPNEQTSLQLQARTRQSGRLHISARAAGRGAPIKTELMFIEPQPKSLAFEDEPLSVPIGATVPLKVGVADQDGILMRSLSGFWTVSAKPASNEESVQLTPDRIVLSAQNPVGEVFLRMVGMPSGDTLRVHASTEAGSTMPLFIAKKTLGFEGQVRRLDVSVPEQVNAGVPIRIKARFFGQDEKREAHTEFPRTIEFYSEYGDFKPEDSVVPKGATYGTSEFVGRVPGQAKVRVSTIGVAVVEKEMLIVVALWQLVTIALFAGTIGGLARFFYYRGYSWDVWPKKTSKGWNPGLVGNAAFSGVFGMVLFLMAKYGLIQPTFDLPHSDMWAVVHTRGPVFLLGIAGGFAGVFVLELLATKLGLADALEGRKERRRTRSTRPAAVTGAVR